tara:strand:+ start:2926 stop:3069 length:144 start_codon:yes stop_codon:yes gene_type:complete
MDKERRLDNISGITVMGCGGFIVFGFLLFVFIVVALSVFLTLWRLLT